MLVYVSVLIQSSHPNVTLNYESYKNGVKSVLKKNFK